MRLLCFSLILACNGRCVRDDDACEAADTRAWYTDEDGDGHGDPLGGTEACTQPASSATIGDDCDDNDGTRWISASLWVDGDGDGFGVGDAVEMCAETEGYVDQDGDCDV